MVLSVFKVNGGDDVIVWETFRVVHPNLEAKLWPALCFFQSLKVVY